MGHRMQNSLLHVVWTEMFVGSVCTQPPYNDKNPPSVFFKIQINHNPFFKSSGSQILGCVTSHKPRPLPRLLIDTGVSAHTHPEWAVISPPLFRRRSRGRQGCLLSDCDGPSGGRTRVVMWMYHLSHTPLASTRIHIHALLHTHVYLYTKDIFSRLRLNFI